MKINESKEIVYKGYSDTVPLWTCSNPEVILLEATANHNVVIAHALTVGGAEVHVKVNADAGSGVREQILSFPLSVDGVSDVSVPAEKKSEPVDKYWPTGG